MNICILTGQIISEVEFRFFYNSKKYLSIVKFEIENYEVKKNNFVKLFAYNELADTIYADYEKGNFIKIVGRAENNGVRITEIYK